MPLADEIFNTPEHMITNQNQRKNSDQVNCPASTGKVKWTKLTGPVTFIYINKYSKTEIRAFLLLTQLIMVIGLSGVQIGL